MIDEQVEDRGGPAEEEGRAELRGGLRAGDPGPRGPRRPGRAELARGPGGPARGGRLGCEEFGGCFRALQGVGRESFAASRSVQSCLGRLQD